MSKNFPWYFTRNFQLQWYPEKLSTKMTWKSQFRKCWTYLLVTTSKIESKKSPILPKQDCSVSMSSMTVPTIEGPNFSWNTWFFALHSTHIDDYFGGLCEAFGSLLALLAIFRLCARNNFTSNVPQPHSPSLCASKRRLGLARLGKVR